MVGGWSLATGRWQFVTSACKHLAAGTLGTVPCKCVPTVRSLAEQLLRGGAIATGCAAAHKRALWWAGRNEEVCVR